MIDTLIDKQDGFEIVRDKLAAILVAEVANQKALATTAGKDPALWDLRIFMERANPWSEYQLEPVDTRPIINISFDNANFDKGNGGVVKQQQARGTFSVDCYGYGVAHDNGGTGHVPGDKEAALEAHRALRLVRNIFMAATYTYLDLRGLVGSRWTDTTEVFKPQIDGRTVQQIVAARLSLEIRYNEVSPQVTGEIIEAVTVEVKRAGTGEVFLTAEYPH